MLPADQLPRAVADPQETAQRLVERGLLTRWQAGQLIASNNHFFLGSYKLLDKLGEGGMGAVFKAEQHPLRGLVSLKVIS